MKEQYTTVTRKGQITIPINIRRRLNLEEGDRIAVTLEGDQVLLRPAEGVVDQTAGMLKISREAISAEKEREQAEKAIAKAAQERS